MAKKKKYKKLNPKVLFVFKLIGYASFILFLLFGYFLYRLDILPMKYFLILAGILLCLDLFSIFSISLFKKPLKIFGLIISLLVLFISSVGIYYSYHTDYFLNQSFRNSKLKYTTTYYLIGNASSSWNELSDVTGTISYLSGAYLIDDALASLNSAASASFESQTYDDVIMMFQDLKSDTISSILVEQSSFDLVMDLNQGFTREEFKVIYSFDVSVEVENDAKNNDSGTYQIYIGGNDFTNRLMDFNMLVTINQNTHQVLLTSVPRDYYIEVYGFDGRKDTLSYMGARGVETNLKSLEKLFDMDIDYFIKINTESLVGIVDQVGGINYCSDTSYTTTHALVLNDYDDSKGQKLYVKKGCQHLSGIEALTVARERKAFPDGDRQRQKNCQAIMMAIFEQLVSVNTITNYNNILNSLSDLYQTSIPRDVISDLIKETINGAKWNVESQSVDGTNAQGYVHLTNIVDYVMNPNMDTVSEARNRMMSVLEK